MRGRLGFPKNGWAEQSWRGRAQAGSAIRFSFRQQEFLTEREGISMKYEPMEERNRSLVDPAQAEDRIRRRAYEIYERRGRKDGSELADWVQAESEVLKSENITKAA